LRSDIYAFDVSVLAWGGTHSLVKALSGLRFVCVSRPKSCSKRLLNRTARSCSKLSPAVRS